MAEGGYTFEEHTAEVQVKLWASTLPELFVQAALALAELMTGMPVPRGGKADEPISLESADRDALLVDWLNELLYRTEMSERPYTAVRLDELTDGKLSGAVGIGGGLRATMSVKAATLYGLQIAETPPGYSATVVLDV